MRNSPETLPIQKRDTETLIDDLCIALREVTVREGGLPNSLQAVEWIMKIQERHCELRLRKVFIL